MSKVVFVGEGFFSTKARYEISLNEGEALVIERGPSAVVYQGPGVAIVDSWAAPRKDRGDVWFSRGSDFVRRWVPGMNVQRRDMRQLTPGWFRHYKVSTNFGWKNLEKLPEFDGGISGKEVYRYLDEGDFWPLLPDGWVACPAFSHSGTTYVVVREGSPKLAR